jgi:hypothetical protein
MLTEGIPEDQPGCIRLVVSSTNERRFINLSMADERVSYNFVLADEEGFVASYGDRIPWDIATEADMMCAVEFALNWLNDKY